MTKKLTLFALALSAVCTVAQAQDDMLPLLQDDDAQPATTEQQAEKQHNYPQPVRPQGLESYGFSTYYFNGGKTYNLLGLKMSQGKNVADFKVNPDGKTYAVAEADRVVVYDLWKKNKALGKIKCKGYQPTALAYNADGTLLAVAQSDAKVTVYETTTRQPLATIVLEQAAQRLAYSPDGLYLAVLTDGRIDVLGTAQYERRTSVTPTAQVNDLCFSPDNSQLAILTADGHLTTYDTTTFSQRLSFEALGEARAMDFHKDGKYAAVVTGDQRIALLNLMNTDDRTYVDNAGGDITSLRFITNSKQENFLAYNAGQNVVYELMDQLSPNYTRLLADRLNDRMNEWLKQRPDESLTDYQARINNQEARAEQMRLFEQEIATELADNLVDRTDMMLGDYSEQQSLLALNFADETLPTIYLNVPRQELADFADTGALEIRNAVYGVNDKDEFELLYADVYNAKTGKTYPFDNRDRKSLDYLKDDESFLPLDIAQQSSAEELKLESLKSDIMTNAIDRKELTENTQITVGTKTEVTTDAQGNRITNYKVSFGYSTKEAFSGKEDFAPGRYKVEQSKAAMSMLAVIKQALGGDLAQYVKPGRQVNIAITGMADAAAINGKIVYDGIYGEYTDQPVHQADSIVNITLLRKEGITSNEQLAFVRALGVKDQIEKNVTALAQMQRQYDYTIELAKETGGQFRRITVEFTFIDAFKR